MTLLIFWKKMLRYYRIRQKFLSFYLEGYPLFISKLKYIWTSSVIGPFDWSFGCLIIWDYIVASEIGWSASALNRY